MPRPPRTQLAEMDSEKPGRAKPDSGATIEWGGGCASVRAQARSRVYSPAVPHAFPADSAAPGRVKNRVQHGGRPSSYPSTDGEARMRGGSLPYPEPRAGEFCQVLGCNRVCGARDGDRTWRIQFGFPLHSVRKYAWAMALCKSHPTRGKICKVLPNPHPNVVRLARQEVHHVRLEDLGSPEVSPVATREKYSAVLSCAGPCHCVRTARSPTHLSRGGNPDCTQAWSACSWLRLWGWVDRGGSRVRGRGPE